MYDGADGSRLTMAEVAAAARLLFGVSIEDLKGSCRKTKFSKPRQAAMVVTRQLTGASLLKVGQFYGRDHTTVLFAERKAAGGNFEEANRLLAYLTSEELRAAIAAEREANRRQAIERRAQAKREMEAAQQKKLSRVKESSAAWWRREAGFYGPTHDIGKGTLS